MARNSVSRHSVTRLNAYSCQARKLSDSELPFRQVSWAEGLSKVKKGEADWEYAKDGSIKGIRFRERQRIAPQTPCTLTMKVMMSVSGEGLKSAYEESDQRYEREESALREKYEVWGLIGDTKAVCVRPRMTPEEIRRAKKLLGIAA